MSNRSTQRIVASPQPECCAEYERARRHRGRVATRMFPLLCGLAIIPLVVTAADPVTPFDTVTPAVGGEASESNSSWLTPERAFHSTAPEPAIARSSFSLLSVAPKTDAMKFRGGKVPAEPRRDNTATIVTTRPFAGAVPRDPVEQTASIRSARGSAGASPSLRVPDSTAESVAEPDVTDPGRPLKKSIRRATAVSAVQETSPFSNFGTADTAVAPPFQPAAARIAEHDEPVSGVRSDKAGLQPQETKNDIVATTAAAAKDAPLPVDQATENIDADSTHTNRPFAGLEKLEESPPLTIENLPRLMSMTVFVLGTCLGTLLLGRRWLMRSGLGGEAKRHSRLQIVASLSVAPRSYLHVVKLDDREVLVGVDSRGLQQMQLVPPSFDAVLQSSASQETRATTLDDATDATASPAARRLFTAA